MTSHRSESEPPLRLITYNLLSPLPAALPDEAEDGLVQGRNFRLARIVSRGQASPEDFWYDQQEAEWVMLVSGRARLAVEGEPEDRELGPGDCVYLPAGCRHQVLETAAHAPTVWLALFATSDADLKVLRPASAAP